MAKKTIHTLEEIYPESAVAAQRERYENLRRNSGASSATAISFVIFPHPAVQKSEATTPTIITARCLRQV